MKTLTLTLLSGLLALGVFANSNDYSELPQVVNYQEFISGIEYPRASQENGTEGRVVVLLSLDSEGKVIGYEFGPSPCSELTEAVRKQLVNLRFTPAKDADGIAVASKIAIPVVFELTI